MGGMAYVPGKAGFTLVRRSFASHLRGARIHHWNVTLTASVKLFVPPASLYHAWKFQVSPGSTATKPVGCGTAVRSTWMLKLGPGCTSQDWL